MNLRRVFTVAQKESREILRDRIVLLLAFLLPPMLFLVDTYGSSRDVANVAFAVVDHDDTTLSRDYASHFIHSHYFRFKGSLPDLRDAERRLTDRKVQFVLVLPEGFQEKILSGRVAEIQTLLDGTFPTTTRTLQGYIEAINAAASGALQTDFLSRSLGIPREEAQILLQPIRLETRYLYNQELRNIWTVTPSLIMFTMLMAAPLLMALSVVREKESGAIYNIYSATITRGEFLAGKLLPNVGISFANAIGLWGLAVGWFGTPFKGSFAFFLLATFLYVACLSCMGLVISLIVPTQSSALMISLVLSVLIGVQFSGMITPVESMKGPNFVLAHAFPALYYDTILRGVFLKGVGLRVFWKEALFLAAYPAGLLWLSHRMFHKRTPQ